MKAINLIPPEERRGTNAPTRTGRMPYVVLGVLAALVGAVALLTSASNAIGDKEAEIARLEVEERDAQAQAEALRPFAEFAAARETRSATVESLARSRFDWERVLEELSMVIPHDIWLSQLGGSVSPDVSTQGGPGIGLRGEVPGPALEMIGCGRSHEAVAGFVAALHDIDGVTRVTAPSSKQTDGGGGSAAGGASGECGSGDRSSAFEVVVAFDEVAVPDADGTPAAPARATSAESTSNETETTGSETS